MNERNDFGAFLAGFIVGGAVGAILALLYAPQPGEETRTVLKEKGIELKERATSASESTVSRLQERVKDLSAQVEELTKTLQERAAEFKEKGAQIVGEAARRIPRKGEAAAEEAPAPEGDTAEAAA